MISVCFQGKTLNIIVIQVYDLTSDAEEAEVEWCYEDLQHLLELTKKDVLFITGDWNAKVGSQEIPEITGKFGLRVQNEAGQRLIVLQREYTSDSNFPFPTIQWTTLQMVNTEIRLIIFFCSQRWRGSIQSAKTSSGAGCGSDHQLCIAKFRLELKKVGETTRPFRYDLN